MCTSRRWQSVRAGFTLIELMFAITVLVVAVLSTFAAQLSAHNLRRTAGETNAATADLQSAMEQLLMLPAMQIPVPGSTYAAGQPIARFNDLHLRNEVVTPAYPGYTPGSAIVPDPLQVVLTITWKDFRGRQRSMKLSSMRTR